LLLLRESGCFGVLLGFESICPATLQRIDKGFNKVSRYRENLERFHANRQAVLGSFVFGFDEDEPSVFEYYAGLHRSGENRLAALCPLDAFPGTRLFTRLEREGASSTTMGLLYFPTRGFSPARMSARQLQEGFCGFGARLLPGAYYKRMFDIRSTPSAGAEC